MVAINRPNWWVLGGSFLLAFMFSLMPLPPLLNSLRPAWVVLVLIYWVMVTPHHAGVLLAWCLGILQDSLTGAVLGQHALALSVVAYIVYLLHLRIRVFPLWQQCLTMLVLVGIHQLLNLMIMRAVSIVPWSFWYWVAAITSALVWPVVNLAIDWASGARKRA